MIKSYEQFYWHIAQLHTTCSRRQPDLVQKVEKSNNNFKSLSMLALVKIS